MNRNFTKLLTALFFAALLASPTLAVGQSLGAAQNFGIVGGSAVTAAVGSAPSQIAGDVGDVGAPGSITGFPPALGAIVIPPFVLHAPNDGPSVAASGAVSALFTSLSTDGGPATAIPDQLAGQSRTPGTYSLGAANLASGGVLHLVGNGTYIFRISSSLTTISTSNISLEAGAQACNVWWQVGSSATIGGTTFAGNVVGFTGTNSMGPDARLEGRMLTTVPGQITLAGNNTINAAFCAALPPPGAVGVSKSFNPSVNGIGGISALTITLTNNNAAPATLTAALSDSLPAGVVIANSVASTTCGGSALVNATPGAGFLQLSAGTIIPGGAPGSCIVTVNVSSASAGAFTNIIPVGALQTSNGNNITPGIALFTVIAGIPPVPTLAGWAMIALVMLLGLGGFVALRQRRSA
jgi:uncharacterized repeat protein (TIGR01451 family)